MKIINKLGRSCNVNGLNKMKSIYYKSNKIKKIDNNISNLVYDK